MVQLHFSADIDFDVDALDEAIAAVVVSGGDVDAAEAASIQSISGYDGGASDYDVTDAAAAPDFRWWVRGY